MIIETQIYDVLALLENRKDNLPTNRQTNKIDFNQSVNWNIPNRQITKINLLFNQQIGYFNLNVIRQTIRFHESIIINSIKHLIINQSIGFVGHGPKKNKVPGSVNELLTFTQYVFYNSPYNKLNLIGNIVGYQSKPIYHSLKLNEIINNNFIRTRLINQQLNFNQSINYYNINDFDVLHNDFDSY